MESEKKTASPDATELLHRILTAVEPVKRKPWFELACAIVLALATTAMAAAREARRFSDDYVLLTVVFASVLFFGGIARAFDSRPLRTTLAALAVLLFVGTLVQLGTMPVFRE